MAQQTKGGPNNESKKKDMWYKFCDLEKHYMHDCPKFKAKIKKQYEHRNKMKVILYIAKNEELSNNNIYVNINDANLPDELIVYIFH